ncbi:hypothetical protein EXIGLDRAFT_721655 [Exidia glandulosa HHB12029]|uniref:Uncharacterized protein n=1 Tax=Exidia glandulosa HHB12029 TaxID=1314781 RepID=A0A165FL12_EXIGL|nr:hypothetical protein EXIGLDRAFT_721655 [Exidia glandulosa HHB12029]
METCSALESDKRQVDPPSGYSCEFSRPVLQHATVSTKADIGITCTFRLGVESPNSRPRRYLEAGVHRSPVPSRASTTQQPAAHQSRSARGWLRDDSMMQSCPNPTKH